jgi:hypothetical protein
MNGSAKQGVGATIASLASLIAALSCCLPLGTLMMAAGSAGASVFSESLRPWLLGLSVASIAFAFFQTYRRGRCDFRNRRIRTVLLWFSAVLVVGMLAAPRYLSSLLAGRIPAILGASPIRPFNEAEFIRAFDAASGHTRVVLLLSPT